MPNDSKKDKYEFIYLAVSKDCSDWVKIGKTSRINAEARIKEINRDSTNIKTFKVYYCQEVKDSQICENQLHAAFDYFIADAEKVKAKIGLTSKPEEFFEIDWRIARAALLCMKTAETLAMKKESPKNKEGSWTPLMTKAQEGDIEGVEKKLLNASKTNINAQSQYGYTPLMWAVNPIYKLMDVRYKKILEKIMDKGPCLELTTNNGKTALMIAAKHGKDYAVKMLLKAGAKKDVKCLGGWTALDYARAYEHKTDVHKNIISLLDDNKVAKLL